MKTILLLLTLFFVPTVMGADYEREKRWADEIVPDLIIGDPVYLQTGNGQKFLNLYTEADKAKSTKAAVIVVHGRGIHPDMGLIGVLRTRLADHGYTTLSVQMPVLWAEARGDDYLPDFPEAGERLAAAVKYLQEKGHKKIALVSHSMGARMSSDYLKNNPAAPLFAWVSVSITNDTLGLLGVLNFPVLDLYGEYDLPQVLDNNNARARAIGKINGSVQIMAPNADHFYEGQDHALVNYVKSFLDRALKRAR
jgi:pimeloyl-ACP methyl ester carboxylesterase